MRGIKFRAQMVDSDEFEYGYIVRYGCVGKEKFFIVPTYASNLYSMEIDKNTIGQYIGLHDKNGVEIYEGDIVNVVTSTLDGYPQYSKCVIRSIFDYEFMARLNFANELEVIGNIWENPELLKSEVPHE